jgi:hypothetical protein
MAHGTKQTATSGSLASVQMEMMTVATAARSSRGYATYRRTVEPRPNRRDGSNMRLV